MEAEIGIEASSAEAWRSYAAVVAGFLAIYARELQLGQLALHYSNPEAERVADMKEVCHWLSNMGLDD